jgi:hypothetical protein
MENNMENALSILTKTRFRRKSFMKIIRDRNQFIMIKREKNLVRLKLEIASLIMDLK